MAERTETLERLRKNPFFQQFAPSELDSLASLLVERTYAPEEIIFLEGEPNTGLWFVGQGRVKIYQIAPSGKEQVLCLLGPSTCFGCCPLFDRDTYPANAQAAEDVTLYILPGTTALELVREKPELLNALLRLFAGRMRHLSRVAEGLVFNCVTGRLAANLLEQAADGGAAVKNGTEVPLSQSHDELAALIGTTGQIIGRALQRLEQMNAVQVQGRRVTLLDLDKLHRIALKV